MSYATFKAEMERLARPVRAFPIHDLRVELSAMAAERDRLDREIKELEAILAREEELLAKPRY